ncbi:hypothetical protein [Pedobacter sp. MR22-3]|uniref:hypothetical protein n=1 Tax=Pedobacter sp. MR22-3 TaxID=2994552 RepID=UPI002247873B|nr:hypothetical protein [Pedobacter sp. MR22-3]MCX2584376.1 hypothetical protein [Pedobacter sp. MR22-3]
MKNSILNIIFTLWFVKAFAQQPSPLNEKLHLDSLEKALQTNRPDSVKANTIFSLVEYWKYKDIVKSKMYLLHGKEPGKKYPYLNSLSLFYDGQYYFNLNAVKAATAFKKAEQSLSIFHNPKAYYLLVNAWLNYALMNKDTKGYKFVARIIPEKALPMAEKGGNKVSLAYFYTRLSTLLMNNYQFAKAALYNQKLS